jgi:hypothetical protein
MYSENFKDTKLEKVKKIKCIIYIEYETVPILIRILKFSLLIFLKIFMRKINDIAVSKGITEKILGQSEYHNDNDK